MSVFSPLVVYTLIAYFDHYLKLSSKLRPDMSTSNIVILRAISTNFKNFFGVLSTYPPVLISNEGINWIIDVSIYAMSKNASSNYRKNYKYCNYFKHHLYPGTAVKDLFELHSLFFLLAHLY